MQVKKVYIQFTQTRHPLPSLFQRQTNRHTRARTYTHTRTHTRTHARTHAHTHIHTHTNTHINTYIHAHKHTHAQSHIHTYNFMSILKKLINKVKIVSDETKLNKSTGTSIKNIWDHSIVRLTIKQKTSKLENWLEFPKTNNFKGMKSIR